MLDPALLRDTAVIARAAHARLAVALTVTDPIEACLCGSPIETAEVTAVIRAEALLINAAYQLERAARLASAAHVAGAGRPALIAEVIK